MRTVDIGTVSSPSAGTLLYDYMHRMLGVTSLTADEGAAAIASFNSWARNARRELNWPEATKSLQVVPDVRVRSVNLTNGGSSYTSAPTVTIAAPGGSGTQATATATINNEGEVNGVAITNEGSGYVSIPSVTFSSGGGSGAAATAVLAAYVDYGSTVGDTGTISELIRVTETDPLTANKAIKEIPFQEMHEAGSDFGLAILLNRSSTAPVWCTYKYAEDRYVETGTESGNQKGAMPYVWSEYVLLGAYIDWLRVEEQHDKAGRIERKAEKMLMDEIFRQDQQGRKFNPTLIKSHHTTARYR